MNGKKAKLLRKAARMVCDPNLPREEVKQGWRYSIPFTWRRLVDGSFRKTYKDMKKAFKTLPHHSKGVAYTHE